MCKRHIHWASLLTHVAQVYQSCLLPDQTDHLALQYHFHVSAWALPTRTRACCKAKRRARGSGHLIQVVLDQRCCSDLLILAPCKLHWCICSVTVRVDLLVGWEPRHSLTATQQVVLVMIERERPCRCRARLPRLICYSG